MLPRGRNRFDQRADQTNRRAKKKTKLSRRNNPVAAPQTKPATNEIEILLKNWHRIVDHAAKADPLSRRYLLDTAPVRIDETQLTVGYDPEFKAEMARFADSRATLAIGRAVQPHLGRMLSICFEPLSPDARPLLPADHPVSNVNTDAAAELTGPMKWYANPVVKKVVEAFNGEIKDIRE